MLAQMGDRKGGDRDVMGMGGDGGLEMERFWGVSESCGKIGWVGSVAEGRDGVLKARFFGLASRCLRGSGLIYPS